MQRLALLTAGWLAGSHRLPCAGMRAELVVGVGAPASQRDERRSLPHRDAGVPLPGQGGEG
eukprot:451211-Prymnesium_polylepis.1